MWMQKGLENYAARIAEQDRRIKALEGLLREIKPVAHLFQWNDLGDQIDTLLKEADQ
jgi:hypothetical protein